jgi:hypothetical protein
MLVAVAVELSLEVAAHPVLAVMVVVAQVEITLVLQELPT